MLRAAAVGQGDRPRMALYFFLFGYQIIDDVPITVELSPVNVVDPRPIRLLT